MVPDVNYDGCVLPSRGKNVARHCAGLLLWQCFCLLDAVLMGRSRLAYTAINIIEACVGALLLRKLLPWYNPLQNLGDWVRLAIGSALIPPLVGGVLVHSLFQPGAAA
jgi:integral membrane sensor domain MASE1